MREPPHLPPLPLAAVAASAVHTFLARRRINTSRTHFKRLTGSSTGAAAADGTSVPSRGWAQARGLGWPLATDGPRRPNTSVGRPQRPSDGAGKINNSVISDEFLPLISFPSLSSPTALSPPPPPSFPSPTTLFC